MSVYSEIDKIYKRFDKSIARFRSSTGISCPPECSICCREWPVEATVLELFPLAREIYLRKQEDVVLFAISEKEARQDQLCALFRDVTGKEENGPCSYYEFRPLVCRLFGFASRRNKFGQIELMTCRIIKEYNPAEVRRAEIALSQGLKLPVYQDAFMRISSMKPGIGFRRFPINKALKEAIETLYWMRPGRGPRFRKAVGFS